MSLDVTLISKTPITKKGTGVFIRENGVKKELTVGEVLERWPTATIEEMEDETECVYSANITHNLGEMATVAGIYKALWRPEEINCIIASDIIPSLTSGLADLKANPEQFKKYDSPNGWGVYDDFIPFVEDYLNACIQYPNAIIEVSR